MLLALYFFIALIWFIRARDEKRRFPAKFSVALVISLIWPLVCIYRLFKKGHVWYDRV
jgi:hypothetical protein